MIHKMPEIADMTEYDIEQSVIDKFADERLRGGKYPTSNQTIRTIIDWYDSLMWDIEHKYRDIKYWFLYRLSPKHMYWLVAPKTIKIGYHDRDTMILHCSMQCLVDYYEHEAETIDWQWDPRYQHAFDEITAIYKWWTVERPLKEKEMDDFYESNTTEYSSIWDLEQYIDEKDKEMLHKLVDIRTFLWS